MTAKSIRSEPADRLSAALKSGDLPAGARARIQQVCERLARPVRTAVFGRTAGGPARLVNALVGEVLLPENAEMPPMQLQSGDVRKIEIVSCDGTRSTVSRGNLDRLDPWTLAMIEFVAPVPLLDDLSFLVVPLDGGSAEIDAALRWASARTEMVLCCTGAPTAEAALWQRLPDPFADHGFLVVDLPEDVVTKGIEAAPDIAGRFRAVHCIGGAGSDGATERLRKALLSHVTAARQEDLEGALALLARYQPRTPQKPAPGCDPFDTPDFSALLDAPTKANVSDNLAPANCIQQPNADIVTFLAAQADILAELCDQPDGDALSAIAPSVLAHCAESIEACNELAAPADTAVVEMMAEASDLVLLMQVESTRAAMTDAVALMLQLRTECETLLCA